MWRDLRQLTFEEDGGGGGGGGGTGGGGRRGRVEGRWGDEAVLTGNAEIRKAEFLLLTEAWTDITGCRVCPVTCTRIQPCRLYISADLCIVSC